MLEKDSRAHLRGSGRGDLWRTGQEVSRFDWKADPLQLDSPRGTPVRVEELVDAVRRFLDNNEEYRKAIDESPYVKALRFVTGKELGRFRKPNSAADA
jgi:hypothetical protein